MELVNIICYALVGMLTVYARGLPLKRSFDSADLATFIHTIKHQPSSAEHDDPLDQDLPHALWKRYVTTKHYPAVPTIPTIMTVKPDKQTVVLTGSSLFLNSKAANCPGNGKRSTRHKRVVLSQDIMRDMYLQLVGEYDKTLLAETLEEAQTNFINLPVVRNVSSPHASAEYSQLREDIEKLEHWFQAVKTNLNRTDEEVKHVESDKDISLDDVLEQLDITRPQLRQLLLIKSSMDLVVGYHSESKRVKRTAATAAAPQGGFCITRGSKTSDGYLHLCTTCAYTTQLPVDRYPQYINEAGCLKTDCHCMSARGVDYGACKPLVHHVKMLRRKQNGCRLMIQDGTQYILDDWELYDQPMHGGCECLIDKNSPYAVLAANPGTQGLG